MVSFTWPWVLILLPLPIALLYWRKAKSSLPTAIKITPRLRKALDSTTSTTSKLRKGRWVLLWLGWLSTCIAIAQPTLPGTTSAQPASGRTMMLVIDLSASMERKDFLIDNRSVDRLSVVKRIATAFIDNRRGDRIGLVLFGAEAFLGLPPSYDLDALKHELNNSGIGMAGRTTAIGDALGLAIQALKSDTANDKAIVLISDGTNNSGTAEPESAAKLAQQLGIRIHTIGLGSENDNNSSSGSSGNNAQLYTNAAADLDEAALQSIADVSEGSFFRARTTNELESIYSQIDLLEAGETIAPPVVVNKDIRHYFVWILLLSMLLHAALPSSKAHEA